MPRRFAELLPKVCRWAHFHERQAMPGVALQHAPGTDEVLGMKVGRLVACERTSAGTASALFEMAGGLRQA
jgi:hypothetical protein